MRMARIKRIAVIGAGMSGLTSAKACLEQGLEVVIFEKASYFGGVWRFQEVTLQDGRPSVMRSTITNTSKEMSAFSDFPPPPEFPNYMPHEKLMEYFESYAIKFGVDKLIRFRNEVVKIEPADDHELTGRWRVMARDVATSVTSDEIYDGVMVASGRFNQVNYPDRYPGQNLYRGRILHNHQLKDATGFEGLEVVVVGLANSGGDAAVELSSVAKQVYISTRRGTWILGRTATNGRPVDQFLKRRFFAALLALVPTRWNSNLLEFYVNLNFNHEDYQLKPKHRFLEQHVVVNDLLPGRILCRKVVVRPDIDHFTEDGVVFKGETEVTRCQAVVFATGYRAVCPFLSEDILKITDNYTPLYRCQFVPTLARPETLAFITFANYNGAFFPVSEMQARWFALLNTGRAKLPNVAQMERDIKKRLCYIHSFYPSERHTNEAEWLVFLDEIAKDIGIMPPIWEYLATDWSLFKALMFGAPVPYQYRLVGPNRWEGARGAILGVQERIDAGLRTRRDVAAPISSTSFTKHLFTIYWIQLAIVFGVFFVLWIMLEIFY